jgi:hypothetical protein
MEAEVVDQELLALTERASDLLWPPMAAMRSVQGMSAGAARRGCSEPELARRGCSEPELATLAKKSLGPSAAAREADQGDSAARRWYLEL